MTIISAAVVNKQGRIILARQFTDISRIRIEGLLSAFPRLLEASVNKQVAYLDAGVVRYVYQPIEDLFLLLVTTSKSNIVEDLATLHLIGRLIPEFTTEGITEAVLEAAAFQLFPALDEVVANGRRESTSVEQIHTSLRMESHEEMLALEAKRQQMENAKRITAEHARALREKRMAGEMGGGGGAYGGIGSDSQGGGGYSAPSGPRVGAYGGFEGGEGSPSYASPAAGLSSMAAPAPRQAAAPLRPGMSLGKARKADITSRVQKEMGGLPASGSPQAESITPQVTAAAATASGAVDGVHVTVEEKISAALNRDGEAVSTDLKGELSVLITDPQMDRVKLSLGPVSPDFTFRAHTKVNKTLFASDHVLAMTDGKAFPVQQPVTILRWRLGNAGGMQMPIAFTSWPEAGSITVEYELLDPQAPPLHHVQVTLPLYDAQPEDVTTQTGSYEVRDGFLLWTVPVVDGQRNSSGNIEVTLAAGGEGAAENVFFPIDVSFASSISIALVRVAEVTLTDSGLPVRFSQDTRLVTDRFFIE